MENLLLHHPWVQFYLMFVGVLLAVFLLDYLCDPTADWERAQTPPNEAAQGRAAPPRRPYSVSRLEQRTNTEVRPPQE